MTKTIPPLNPFSRMFMAGCATCLTLALASVSATAQDSDASPQTDRDPPTMQQVEQAWQAGDYVAVREGLKYLAEENGTALATYRYGRILVEGRGGPRDIAGAVKWLRLAADENHVDAMTLLARLHLSANTLTGAQDDAEQPDLDPARATELLSRAAALGGAEAQFLLGQIYLTGTNVEADAGTAFNWYLAAAEQGHTEAQYILSQAYDAGVGTDADPEAAVTWLRKAAENGHLPAQFYLALRLEQGDGTPQSNGEALQWYRRAAENGLGIAQRELGTHYLRGDIVEQNTAEGLRWLQAAAQAGEVGAMANLGFAYANGMAVEQDHTTAANWYAKAAQNGLGRAMIALASLYENGLGVEKNVDTAISLYLKALETNDRDGAASELGRLAGAGALAGKMAPHRAVNWALAAATAGNEEAEAWLRQQADEGIRPALTALATIFLGTEDRLQEGITMLEDAANAGDADAQLRLGKMHMTGENVELDYVAAHKWFNISATFGVDEAAKLRGQVGDLMTPEQLAEAQAETRNWFATQEPQPPKNNQTVRSSDPEDKRE